MMKEYLDLQPAKGAHGTVRLPGSKSISNRILLLSALARARPRSRICSIRTIRESMLDALCALGVGVERTLIPAIMRSGRGRGLSRSSMPSCFSAMRARLFAR